MNKVFILDDSLARLDFLKRYVRRQHGKDTLVVAALSASEAMEKLEREQPFDYLYLDHDLGGRVFVDSRDPNTGYQVAKFIVSHRIQYGRCIIHTLNEDAGRLMGKVLSETPGARVHLYSVMRMMR